MNAFTAEQLSVLILSFLALVIPYTRTLLFSSSVPTHTPVQKRMPTFDIIRGYSILAVIGIHVVQFFVEGHPESFHTLTLQYVINNVLRFAIPVFLICSGILLNPSNVETGSGLSNFYTRKLLRLFIPYILFSVALDLTAGSTIDITLWHIVSGRVLSPYYFMTVLFQLYLLYPLLVRFRYQVWFLPATFLVSVWAFFHPGTWRFFDISTFLPYLFFFAFGIAKRDSYLSEDSKPIAKDLFFVFLISIYIVICIIDPEYYFNMRIIYGVALFHLLFQLVNARHLMSFSLIPQFIGRISLWVYLIHFPIVSELYTSFAFLPYPYYAKMVGIFGMSVFISVLCAVILSSMYRFVFGRLMHTSYEA